VATGSKIPRTAKDTNPSPSGQIFTNPIPSALAVHQTLHHLTDAYQLRRYPGEIREKKVKDGPIVNSAPAHRSDCARGLPFSSASAETRQYPTEAGTGEHLKPRDEFLGLRNSFAIGGRRDPYDIRLFGDPSATFRSSLAVH
jgi:hypothetical protein